jgi:2-C-methyl-D-erythritol 2,4-cyclodiphosphate synthase
MTTCNVKIGIGQKSRRFLPEDASKPCVVAGVIFEDAPGFAADSDGDVVFHSICNAIASITGEDVLSGLAAELCYKNGITDSQVYVEKALETLGSRKIEHVALSLEGKRPKMNGHCLEMREKIAEVLKLSLTQVGLTVTSGTGFTGFGCGEGVQCYCVITTNQD